MSSSEKVSPSKGEPIVPQVRIQEQKSWLFRAKKFILSRMSYVSGGRFLMSHALSRQDRLFNISCLENCLNITDCLFPLHVVFYQ